MGVATSSFLRWTEFRAPTLSAEALVLQIIQRGNIASGKALADRWAPMVPRSAFAGLEMDLGPRRLAFAPIQEVVQSNIKPLEIGLPQIVMIGSGHAARRILDLAVCNVLTDIHAVLIDLPAAGMLMGHLPARGAFRFVQHPMPDDPDGRHFGHAIQSLRAAGLDLRTMVMPEGAAATERATDTFLVELVAHASRSQPALRRAGEAPLPPEHRA